MKWDANHWLAFALVLGGIGTIVGGLSSWSEALQPSFVAGVIINVAGVIRAIYSGNGGAK